MRQMGRCSRTSGWQETDGRLVKHARHYWLLFAEDHLNQLRFGAMLARIALQLVLTGPVAWTKP